MSDTIVTIELVKRKYLRPSSYWLAKKVFEKNGFNIPIDFLYSLAEHVSTFAILEPSRYDPYLGEQLLLSGIKRGSLECKYYLMLLYLKEDFHFFNVEKGLHLLDEMVEIDHYEEAYYLKGILLLQGKVLPKDLDKSYLYIKAAADSGYPFAKDCEKHFQRTTNGHYLFVE